jgi:hypothetical protein
VGTIGAVPYVMVKAFPPVVRFSGLSFSYNVAYAIFGGLTPMVVTALLKKARWRRPTMWRGCVPSGWAWAYLLASQTPQLRWRLARPSNDGLSSNCHNCHIVFTRPADTWARSIHTPILLGVRHETEAFDGGNDLCRRWRCDRQRGCRC